MKNEIIVERENIQREVYNIWKTKYFKDAQKKENSFISNVVRKLSLNNICFYEFNNEKFEKRHMTPWFNHIGLRKDYSNDYIHDLYLIHEMFHVATLPSDIYYDFEEWKDAMWTNELYASLATEVFIYFFHKDLRKETFKEKIWFDYLLEEFKIDIRLFELEQKCVFEPHSSELLDKIIKLRLDFRNGKSPRNKPEEWFVRYNNYNEWFKRWEDKYIEVQKARALFNTNLNDFIKFKEKNQIDGILFKDLKF